MLCIDCKYFKSTDYTNQEYAKCTKSYTINLITGAKVYPNASAFRSKYCKGENFKSKYILK